MVVLAITGVLASEQIARQVALEEATSRSEAIARVLSAVIDDRLRDGDARSRRQVGETLAATLHDDTVSHVRVWAEDGTVMWADDVALVGQHGDLSAAVRNLFGTEETTAGLSSVDAVAPEEPGRFLEVYVGSFDRDGRPWVFEAYLSTEAMERNQEAIVSGMLPIALGGILLLQVAVLPLAVSLAHRVQRSQDERGELLRRTLLASDLERRRIAHDLHDGVIQDLTGLSYALPVLAAELPERETSSGARRALQQVSQVLARDIPALRGMLADLHPPDLAEEGLAPAVEDLASRAGDAGVTVSVHLAEPLEASPEAVRLAYRVVREGLRNAVKHAPGSRVEVHVLRRGSEVVVRVLDDGPGLGDAVDAAPGHLGVRLLADLVRDLGGRFHLGNGAKAGAVMEATFAADVATV